MAIQGKFDADFASFYDACLKAEVSLKGFESGAGKVETSLNRMVDSFSGRKIISEATLMAEAIERGGGTSKLTATELARVGATAAEAAAKFRALGQEVPPQLHALAEAAGRAGPRVTDLRGSFATFDSLLASMGVNIGAEVRGLGELGAASGATVTSLGVLATGGLVLGTAIGAWKIGRAVSEFFDLDKTIGDATAKLLGFGDAAAQAAGAKADVLARASKHAGVEIKDMAVAMAINEEASKTWQAATIAANDALTRLTAPAESAKQLAAWRAELETVQSAGLLGALTADVESHAFGVDVLAKRYGVSSGALETFTRQAAAGAAVHAKNADLLKKLAADQEAADKKRKDVEEQGLVTTSKLWEDYYALRVSHGGTANEQAIAQINAWATNVEADAKKAGTATSAFYVAFAALSKEKLAGVGMDWDVWKTKSIPALEETARNERKRYDEMLRSGKFFREELDAQKKKVEEAEAAARGMGSAYVKAFDDAAAAAKKLQDETKKAAEEAAKRAAIEKAANLAKGGAFEVTRETFAEAARKQGANEGAVELLLRKGYSFEQALLWAKHPDWPPPENPGPRVPGFAGGVTNFSGGLALVGERGPEIVNLPRGSDVLSAGRGGGGAVSVTNNFYVNGTADQVAQKIKQIIMRELKSTTQFGR